MNGDVIEKRGQTIQVNSTATIVQLPEREELHVLCENGLQVIIVRGIKVFTETNHNFMPLSTIKLRLFDFCSSIFVFLIQTTWLCSGKLFCSKVAAITSAERKKINGLSFLHCHMI